MATTTTNLGLTKPAVNDAADISVLNANFDKIDVLGGYGLGKASGKMVSNPDEAVNHGFYNVNNDYYTGDGTFNDWRLGWCSLLVERRENVVCQTAKYYNEAMWFRASPDGGATWQPWEWVNPPMSIGVEYRTTERWQGKPVYTCLVNCGNPVDGSTKSVNHNLTITHCISCEACASTGDSFPVDYGGANTGSLIHANAYANTGRVHVYTSGGYSATAIIYAKLRYTKD